MGATIAKIDDRQFATLQLLGKITRDLAGDDAVAVPSIEEFTCRIIEIMLFKID